MAHIYDIHLAGVTNLSEIGDLVIEAEKRGLAYVHTPYCWCYMPAAGEDLPPGSIPPDEVCPVCGDVIAYAEVWREPDGVQCMRTVHPQCYCQQSGPPESVR